MTHKEWNDSIMQGVTNTVNLLTVMLKERSQLYGTIIHLMLQFEKREFTLPPFETFQKYAEKYYILFDNTGEDEMKVFLKRQEDDPKILD